MIAGLETVTGGTILLNGKDVTWEPAGDRDIAFVFQFFALYPHMSVWANIAFPLQAQGVPRAQVKQRVDEVLRMLGIDALRSCGRAALSGGDQQRVALARALVRRPAAFLMDEPLGALDADLRESMRAEIKRLHLSQHATTVYVTHDQIEAMAMGDRIVVMSEAVVQQVGTPVEVYHNPANLFVARFIGSPGMNLVTGRLCGRRVVHLPGDNRYPVPQRLAARPRRAGCSDERGRSSASGRRRRLSATSAELRAEVYSDDLHGAYTMLHLSLDGAGADRAHPRRPEPDLPDRRRRSASTSTRRWCASSIRRPSGRLRRR